MHPSVNRYIIGRINFRYNFKDSDYIISSNLCIYGNFQYIVRMKTYYRFFVGYKIHIFDTMYNQTEIEGK
jgi:hypothetical protein